MIIFKQKDAKFHLSSDVSVSRKTGSDAVSPISFITDYLGVLFCFVKSSGHLVISVPGRAQLLLTQCSQTFILTRLPSAILRAQYE